MLQATLHRRCRFQDLYGWIVLRIIIIYHVPAKLCKQRDIFSHDVEMNNKGILHLDLHLYLTFSDNPGIVNTLGKLKVFPDLHIDKLFQCDRLNDLHTYVILTLAKNET